jgi:hypothetical protein
MIRHHRLNQGIEILSVIFITKMGQLVYHDIIHRRRRGPHQPPGKADSVFGAAAPEAAFRPGDGHPLRGQSHQSPEVTNPIRQDGAGPGTERLFLRVGGLGQENARPLPLKSSFDPVVVICHKLSDQRIRTSCGRTYNDGQIPRDLKSQRPSVRTDDRISHNAPHPASAENSAAEAV